jgi:signal transduction histidine kinase
MHPDSRFRFLLIAEHELRSPLLAAIHMADTALRRGEPTREDVIRIQSLCKNMHALLSTLGIFASLDSGDGLRPYSDPVSFPRIASILRSVVRDADALGRRSNPLELVIDEWREKTKFEIDVGLLEVALWNVLESAIENSYAETSIRVAARITDRLEVKVTHKGLAIHPNDISHVFERGWRLPSGLSVGRSGIGIESRLWIVNEVVKALGGAASIEAEGNYTTIKLQLPYSEYEDIAC